MSIPSKMTAAHFSPTNGTLKAVHLLSEKLNIPTDYIDLTVPEVREQEFTFQSDDLLIAACPVYAGQIPRVLKLFRNLKGTHTPCILIAAYGNRHYDDTLAQMKCILEEQGFVCIGGMACIIPHVFSSVLGAGRPDEEDQQLFAVLAQKMREKLKKETVVSVEFPGNPRPEVKLAKPVVKLRETSICVLCMECIKECPTRAIDLETKEVDSVLCINCMRCCYVCGPHARTFNAEDLQTYLESNFSKRRSVECFI